MTTCNGIRGGICIRQNYKDTYRRFWLKRIDTSHHNEDSQYAIQSDKTGHVAVHKRKRPYEIE